MGSLNNRETADRPKLTKSLRSMLKTSIKIVDLSQRILFIAFIWSIGISASVAQSNPNRLNYIEKYKDIAISEMERTGVPASIKLAQGILESNSGKSTLARRANNHFGMKCGSQWKGKTFYRQDDDYDDQGNLLESCFRVYKSAEASFVAHSEFLRDPRKAYRYGFLFNLPPNNYKRWALGLKKAGYATNPKYPDHLISIIEAYELYVYDNMTNNDIVPTPPDLPATVNNNLIVVNNLRTALAKEGETVATIATKNDIAVKRLLKYNESLSQRDQVLNEDERIFLQPKRSYYQGKRKYHYVQNGETMLNISQLYGVKLDALYRRNRLPEGKQAASGSKIKLRGWRVSKKNKPKVRTKQTEDIQPTIPVRDEPQDPDIIFDSTIPSIAIEDMDTPKADTSGSSGESPITNTTSSNPSPTTNSPTNNSDNTSTIPTVDPNPPITNPTTTNPPSNPQPNNSKQYYTVKAGDTLYRISRKFGTSVSKLQEYNGLSNYIIGVGQRLRVQ